MQAAVSGPAPGDVIAEKYRVVERIGVGGFGVVFKAVQLDLDREMALKTMLPHLASIEGVAERFKREAKMAGGLRSPHTVTLYESGSGPGGLLFLAMELLEGAELEDVLKKGGAMEPERTRDIAIQILESLEEAHDHEIVHRDLKPSNVFLTTEGRHRDFVKVLDFGIAKAMHADEEEGVEEKLTATGQALGTPQYMAPEQIRGKNIGPHTDIYSLGLIIVEMLTGTVAVQGGTPLEAALVHVNPDPIPLPEGVQNSALGPIIRKALEKNWKNRYQSAAQMIADLEAVNVAQMPTQAMPPIQPTPFRADTGRMAAGVATTPSSPMAVPGGVHTPQSAPYVFQSQELAQPEERSRAPKIVLLVLLFLLFVGGGAFAVFVVFGDNDPAPADSGTSSDDEGSSGAQAGNSGSTQAGGVEQPPALDPVPELPPEETQPEETPPEETPPEEVVPEEAVPEDIALTFESVPEGAQVSMNGEIIGATPFTLEQPKGEGSGEVVFHLSGRREAKLEVDLAESGTYNVKLRKKARDRTTSKNTPAETKPKEETKTKPKEETKTKPKEETKKGSYTVD